MATPIHIRIAPTLFGVLNRRCGTLIGGQPDRVQGVQGQITPKMGGGDQQAAHNLREIQTLPPRHVFFAFHSSPARPHYYEAAGLCQGEQGEAR